MGCSARWHIFDEAAQNELGGRENIRVEAFAKNLALNFNPPKISACASYCTKFGAFGNERHLLSGERFLSRTGFAGFVPRLAFLVNVVISANALQDVMSG